MEFLVNKNQLLVPLPFLLMFSSCTAQGELPLISSTVKTSFLPTQVLQFRCGGALSLCFLCYPLLSLKKQRKQCFEDESLQQSQWYRLEVRLCDTGTKVRGVFLKGIGADLWKLISDLLPWILRKLLPCIKIQQLHFLINVCFGWKLLVIGV